MKKRLLYTTSFVFLWVVVFFIVEGIFRLVGIGYSTDPFERVLGTPYYRDNPDFLNKYYPGRKTTRAEAKFKNLFLVHKPTNGFRIVVLGGSTAQGWPFEPNQSFGKMIEVVLQRLLPQKHVEVINLGYSAMSSYYVADVVKKILRYKVDVILLYTGQNEYYGTLSATTGGGHFTKRLYLFLREWRVFQVLFALFEKRTFSSQTLMASQFANRHVLPGTGDEKVADAFVLNLREIFKEALKYDVPVVVYEMAANLIHMPPFASVGEKEVAPLILSYQHLFRRETWKSKETATLLAQWQERFPSNAHVWYISGIAQRVKGEDFLPALRLAKDLDVIPFRYREILRQRLSQEIQRQGVSFISLQEEIEKRFGKEGFGRLLFIDHLHFTYRGQTFLAELGAKAVASLFFPELGKEIEKTFADIEKQRTKIPSGVFVYNSWLDEGMYFTVYDEFMAIQNILILLSQSPYREMLIPFIKDPQWTLIGMLSREPFKTIMLSYEKQTNYALGNFLLLKLTEQKRWDMIEMLLQAYRHNNPGWYAGYKNCADFYVSQGRWDEALQWYGMAYLLAEREMQKALQKQGKAIAEKLGKKEQWPKVVRELAKNPWFSYNTTHERRRL